MAVLRLDSRLRCASAYCVRILSAVLWEIQRSCSLCAVELWESRWGVGWAMGVLGWRIAARTSCVCLDGSWSMLTVLLACGDSCGGQCVALVFCEIWRGRLWRNISQWKGSGLGVCWRQRGTSCLKTQILDREGYENLGIRQGLYACEGDACLALWCSSQQEPNKED